MSDKQREKSSGDPLNALSEEQLRDILRSELLSEKTDVPLIKRVNAVLRSKSGQKMDCDVHSAWQDLMEEYSTSEPLYDDCPEPNDQPAPEPRAKASGKRPRFRIAVAAAILAVLIVNGTLTAHAFGFDLWGVIVNWTNETFRFTSREQPIQSGTDDSQSDTTNAFSDIRSALKEHGITEKVLPTYLPNGFTRSYAKIDETTENTTFVYMYSSGDRNLILRYTAFSTPLGSSFQKDEGDPEIYEAGGVEHYIMTNVEKYLATWTVNNLECSISGLDSKEELIKMIDSIYKE